MVARRSSSRSGNGGDARWQRRKKVRRRAARRSSRTGAAVAGLTGDAKFGVASDARGVGKCRPLNLASVSSRRSDGVLTISVLFSPKPRLVLVTLRHGDVSI